jgi:2-polyprenyl-3-methyl-5-hydroxy-6-metoxy-1,4-benzoquinol methylase
MALGIRSRIRALVKGEQPVHRDPRAGTWEFAQTTEQKHASALWFEFGNPARRATALGERIKNSFLIDELETFIGMPIEQFAQGKRVIDVACGPVSFASQMKGLASLEGVDPLKYPDWVYEQYDRRGFKVHVCRLEDLRTGPYDIAVCYNALQHFEDLDSATKSIFDLLAPGGECLIVDYLEVPTDEAHLLFLTQESMDASFKKAGFSVRSERKMSRLPGYVEMKGGHPMAVYLAALTRSF